MPSFLLAAQGLEVVACLEIFGWRIKKAGTGPAFLVWLWED